MFERCVEKTVHSLCIPSKASQWTTSFSKDTVTFVKDLSLAEVKEEDIEQMLLSHRQELTNENLLDIEAENKREQEERQQQTRMKD
ncbi:hypothetical protein E2C01_055830 [Portunus trituberculatus]|uniref:Uncharacterized protein n=1 Tax=Portunus trituberculatus TaxID=210409 RepID=A0A5B7GYR1_PORTR|nr:hypothetical protein [Portunus trituberculatus]